MHPRNPYSVPPDFLVLAESYPELKPYLIHHKHGTTLNFQNVAAQRCLTHILLKRDFNITIDIPEDRLCPPVPNRLNYILWLQDIIDSTWAIDPPSEKRRVKGVDIGTGASAIYPLLGSRSRKNWDFVATEVDEQSFQYAKLNTARNGLQDRVTLLKVNSIDNIFPFGGHLQDRAKLHYDFTMCNPPFYASRDEILRSAEAKETVASSICSGADTEMITEGGEVAFVSKMIMESLECKTVCRWYTSMLGKMGSLMDIVSLFHKYKIDNYAVTQFIQGQTRRWAIAWTFTNIRLPDTLTRIPNGTLKSLMPSHNRLTSHCLRTVTLDDVRKTLPVILQGIDGITLGDGDKASIDAWGSRGDLFNQQQYSTPAILVYAKEDTWSRAARRKKKGMETVHNKTAVSSRDSIGVGCRVECEQDQGGGDKGISLHFDWIKGKDRTLFESFAGHVRRKLDTSLGSMDVDVHVT